MHQHFSCIFTSIFDKLMRPKIYCQNPGDYFERLLHFTGGMIYISVWVAAPEGNTLDCERLHLRMCFSPLHVYSLTSNTFHDLQEQRANRRSLTHEIRPQTPNTLEAVFKYLLVRSRTNRRGGIERNGGCMKSIFFSERIRKIRFSPQPTQERKAGCGSRKYDWVIFEHVFLIKRAEKNLQTPQV